MTNLQCAIAVLASHREARGWTDEAVALDLLAQLGLDGDGEAKHAAPALDPSRVTEDQVVAAEAAAAEAAEKAKAVRGVLHAQREAQAFADVTAADHAKAAKEAREAEAKDRAEVAADRAKAAKVARDAEHSDQEQPHVQQGRADRTTPPAARAQPSGRSDGAAGRPG